MYETNILCSATWWRYFSGVKIRFYRKPHIEKNLRPTNLREKLDKIMGQLNNLVHVEIWQFHQIAPKVDFYGINCILLDFSRRLRL